MTNEHMHDLHVADKIHKLVLEQADENKLEKVRKIQIKLGSVIEHGDEINDSNLIFNMGMLAKGTKAEGAEIIVKKVPGNDWELISISGE